MKYPVEIHTIEWRGIAVEIRYEADWLGFVGDMRTAHFDITAIRPERAPLPITETGYRSHFANPDGIAALGGPVAFVRAWLDHDARSAAWKEWEARSRQMSLF